MASENIKITRLSDSIRSPCYILRIEDVNILLDCPVDLSVLRNFVPNHPLVLKGASNIPTFEKKTVHSDVNMVSINNQLYFDTEFKLGFLKTSKFDEIQLDTIDVILISNSLTMLGLPFLINNPMFYGKVYATEPTVQFGKIMMLEMVKLIERLSKDTKKLDIKSEEFLALEGTIPFCDTDITGWYNMYTEKFIHNCLTHIERVSFDQPIDLFGLVEVQGVCSGFTIGSCNWLISTKSEKIGYISHSSGIVSHSSPLEIQKFRNIDILLVGTLITENHQPIEKMCDDLCAKICETILNNGNVLIPINCIGIFFDLIEKVYIELNKKDMSHIPMFVLGPESKSSISIANIYGEWLNKQRENQLYNADSPFIFDKLMKSGNLIPCEDISGYFSEICKRPSIVFASHPSLRLGPVVHLIRAWGKDERNALFLVDTENYNLPPKKDLSKHVMDRILAPYSPLSMQVHYYPLEIRLKSHELPALIDQITPPNQVVIVPNEGGPALYRPLWQKLPEHVKQFEIDFDQTIEIDPNYNKEPFEIRYKSFNQELQITYPLIESIHPITVNNDSKSQETDPKLKDTSDNNTSICLFEANIKQRDGQFILCTPSEMYQPKLTTNNTDSAGKNVNGKNNINNTVNSVPMELNSSVKEKLRKRLFGKMDIDKLMVNLKSKGCLNFKLEMSNDADHLIVFRDEDALIQISGNDTHVLCDNDETRKKIKDAILATFIVLSV